MKIESSVALVTGASGGIGKALITELVARKALKVYAAARDPKTVEHLVERFGGVVVALPLDVSSPASVSAAATVAKDVTLVINNAGFCAEKGALSAADVEDARREMEVNYFGPLQVSRSFAPVLASAGGGAILNVLSFLSLVTLPLMGTYSASKAAALSLTRTIRAELAAQGTLVVGAMPVQVDTAMGAWTDQEKVAPQEAASDMLDAVEAGETEVFPGALSRGAASAYESDPKGLQAQLAGLLPA